VRELVDNASDACAWFKAHHPVEIHIPEELSVSADPAFLQKVLCNLFDNAAKYSPAGTPIIIAAEPKDDGVLLSVSDQGSGIDQQEQSLIFERFYRGKLHTSRVAGTGMGLAISRAIVQAHGGDISVMSQPGRGSVFAVFLPARSPSHRLRRDARTTTSGNISTL